jgi:hypothetical protein
MTITTTSDFTNQLAEFDKIQDTCKKILQTKHYQKLGEEGVHIIMAKSKALGIHPFEALNGGFYVVQGKVGMSTEMMAALVRQRGHSITKDPKSNNELCILRGKRADNGDEWICSFSKEDALAAGLWGSATWKKYPAVMLYNRCMSMLFRQLFPDLSLGAGYVEDELREITRTGEYAQKQDVKQLDMAECVEVKKEGIEQEEAFLIESFLKQTPLEYQEKLNDWLKKKGYSALTDMPREVFEEVLTKLKIKVAAVKQAAMITEEEEAEAA